MGLVGTLGVIESEVVTETDFGISPILICLQIYLLVFYCLPQPLDKQVVIIASFPIHADFDPVLFQEPDVIHFNKKNAVILTIKTPF